MLNFSKVACLGLVDEISDFGFSFDLVNDFLDSFLDF